MYYDPYRLAFVYFSDFAISSPLLLNALAMKYVVLYHCLDFFVDEEIYNSPLLPLHAVEEEQGKALQENVDTSLKHFLKEHSAAFFSPKKKTEKKNVPIVTANRFLYQGKTSNYKFLMDVTNNELKKKNRIKEMVFGLKPSLDCLFQDVMDKDLECDRFNYREFKKRSLKAQ